MKTTIFTAIFAMLATLPIKAFSPFGAIEDEDKEDIKLDGRTEDEREKSLTLPFGAYQENNREVCIISYDAYQSATICILNANGQTMDYCTSGLSPLQIVSFDISNYANGRYTLVISTPTGTYLSGVIEI